MTQLTLTRSFLADCDGDVVQVGAHGPLHADHRTFTEFLKDMGHAVLVSIDQVMPGLDHDGSATNGPAKNGLSGFRSKLSGMRETLENTTTATHRPR